MEVKENENYLDRTLVRRHTRPLTYSAHTIIASQRTPQKLPGKFCLARREQKLAGGETSLVSELLRNLDSNCWMNRKKRGCRDKQTTS